MYDGPFCVLSLVDNRAFIRLSFRVLEHDPTQNDMRRFLADFKARLDVRGLAVRGVTTDGSELYPEPLKELWPDVPHQICEFHVIKEITKAVLHALAATRKKLRDRIPKQPRGRPRKAERAQSRKATRQQQQVSKLFEHRYLFVQHRLTADQKTTLQRITRGLAHLRRLRQIMEEVYRLFDRRCRTETALARLAQLRGRVSRCKRLGRALDKLSSPNLEKALTFLDDKLLPATSNAVERSNRRYRKAQKSIYSVRTAEHIRQRIALDMQRDQQAPIAHRPRRPCIRPVLGRKNSKNDATVSENRGFRGRGVGRRIPSGTLVPGAPPEKPWKTRHEPLCLCEVTPLKMFTAVVRRPCPNQAPAPDHRDGTIDSLPRTPHGQWSVRRQRFGVNPAGLEKSRGRMLLSGLGPAPPGSNMPPHSGLGCKGRE